MKTLFARILKFTIFLAILYSSLLIVFFNFNTSILHKNINYRIGSYGHLYTRLKEVKLRKNIDFLFLGASHTYRGFDPRIFKEKGYSSFNLGSSAQTPLQTEVLLNRYLDKLNPKVILYDVYPLIFSIDGIESASDIIANDKNDLYSVKMALIQNQISVYNTLIYALFMEISGNNDTLVENKVKLDDTYISGGFVESNLKYDRLTINNPIPTNYVYRNDQVCAFERILKLIKKRNIRIILLQAPTSKLVFNSVLNMNYTDSMMKTYGEYYNFNNILNLNDSLHFNDPDHLNQLGVDVFNHKLINILDK